jgi:hypothetical protein
MAFLRASVNAGFTGKTFTKGDHVAAGEYLKTLSKWDSRP